MKAIDLVKSLTADSVCSGLFYVVDNSFNDANTYIDWLCLVTKERLTEDDIYGGKLRVFRGFGYNKIRKYLNKKTSHSVIVYSYTKCYKVESPFITLLETKKTIECDRKKDVLIEIFVTSTEVDSSGCYIERGYIVELLK